MTVTIERRLPLQGSCNFRDIGGYETRDGSTVRWKRLYRSDALHGLTPDDIALIAPLGVATLIDLRSHREFEASGHSPIIAAHGTLHKHLPFLPESTAPTNYDQFPPLSELYVQMIEGGAATIRAVFETLADNTTYPAVVHCAVGKDRTGVTIALLLRTLGVSDEVIVADYALTDGFLAEGIARLRAMGGGADLDQLPAFVLRAHAETMAGFLATVDAKFGGTNQLLADAGILPGTQSEIRALLLERV
ncbi:MAG: tyrosine-protein phosphatase [Thermomicrobiales bacterium]